MDKISHLHITLFMLLMINNYIKPSEYSEDIARDYKEYKNVINQFKINETVASIIQPSNKLKIISQSLNESDSAEYDRIFPYIATAYHKINLYDEDNKHVGHIYYSTNKTPKNKNKKSSYFSFFNKSENEPYDKITYIYSLNVEPEYERKGIATKLMNTVIDHAKEENAKSVLLLSTSRARDFYNKLGFHPANNLPGMYQKDL